jgi:prepilin-type N-terminal cleavage/methylation domain-containing protein
MVFATTLRVTHSTRGFTLMELLVVVAIIAVLAALLTPRIASVPVRTVPAIVQFLESERATAIKVGKATQIVYSGTSLISAATNGSFVLGEDEHLEIRYPPPGDYFPSGALTTFYPDGSIAATELLYVTSDTTYAIRMSPFEGKIHYQTVR